jgi:hypothetical protein
MQTTASKMSQPVKCPDVVTGDGGSVVGGQCVSTTVFVSLMFLQVAIIISYLIYR